eukprot:scaffold149_cov43-Prasinocladus_malaysianus.AAC.1
MPHCPKRKANWPRRRRSKAKADGGPPFKLESKSGDAMSADVTFTAVSSVTKRPLSLFGKLSSRSPDKLFAGPE